MKKKDRRFLHVTSTAKLIIREALPIQCVEAVFLGAYLTADIIEVRETNDARVLVAFVKSSSSIVAHAVRLNTSYKFIYFIPPEHTVTSVAQNAKSGLVCSFAARAAMFFEYSQMHVHIR